MACDSQHVHSPPIIEFVVAFKGRWRRIRSDSGSQKSHPCCFHDIEGVQAARNFFHRGNSPPYLLWQQAQISFLGGLIVIPRDEGGRASTSQSARQSRTCPVLPILGFSGQGRCCGCIEAKVKRRQFAFPAAVPLRDRGSCGCGRWRARDAKGRTTGGRALFFCHPGQAHDRGAWQRG